VEHVILARHGESEYNPRRLVNGDPSQPVGLTERGREDARRLGEALAHAAVDLCVVTEFPRTMQTADIALAGRDVLRLVVPDLNDPRFGQFEGRPIEEVRAFIREHGTTAAPAGSGESRVEVIRRHCRGFELVAGRPEPAILVVAHGLPTVAVRMAAAGDGVPLTLHGLADDHAKPYTMSRDELLGGVASMREWAREQEAAA
jgi:2,3-bisphosphoglycerate-dependent phosphoglycerate mutase